MEEKEKESRESEIKEEEFGDHFPVLSREIKEGEKNISESEMRTVSGSKKDRRFQGYTPGVVDFLCRCETEEEAMEIIEYMLKKGDLTEEYANMLKNQLKEKGLEFFGEHRNPGYYEKA
ncbi:MAG: DUF2095 family protein [Candidatus Heimdallarchaeota archaeon]|nr:DUF2095 family protein [Candidatus Heimdallarchaeota archaeon]MCK4878809.1 DUF2095 family protein [Candidatus Heimdallarchaeota archaeon]